MSEIPPYASAKLSAPIDLPLVRSLFSRPERVAESGFLRREISQRMQERLALIKLVPECLLDAGCGEGADISALQKKFTGARIFGIDGAYGMLAKARDCQRAARTSVNRFLDSLQKWLPVPATSSVDGGGLVCGDFAQLPFAKETIDMLWSNLALHWHPQPDRVLAEWRRVLQVEGLLMFSSFGPDTFKEVREAFQAVDAAPHALPFVDMHDIGDMLVNAGFATPVMDMETITVTYTTPQRLLADVRAWGGNPLETRGRGLMGRAAQARLWQALEERRGIDGKIPLTFEVVYGHAFKVLPKKTADGESIIHFSKK